MRLKLLYILYLTISISLSSGLYIHTKVARSSCHERLSTRLQLRMSTGSNESDMKDHISKGEYETCLQILKRNPLTHLSLEDGKDLLNNIDKMDVVTVEEKTEATSLIYKRLSRQKVLKGFGCIESDYPETSVEISPVKLEEISGLPITALTPRERANYWRVAGIAFCLSEYVIGSKLGIDPLYTLIPATLLLFLSDQLFLRGAVFESVYQTLFPEYKKKIIYHEAGHFLMAYLLGVPIRDCITSAWEARKNSEIKGQAGTIFYDTKVADELAKQQISRSSINRLSVIIMGGIAAEATEFGKSEGGIADEQSLITFLNGVQPPWNILRIQGQARWAALQAILLIREHKEAYNALVRCLEEGKGIGDCVAAIESNLPQVLPSVQRRTAREEKRKEQERERLSSYVSMMTTRVGGVAPGNITTADTMTSSAASRFVEEESRSSAVEEFTRRIRTMEQAVIKGDLGVPGKQGGVWLNDLRGLRGSSGADLVAPPLISLPVAIAPASTMTPQEMLESHRGFRTKQLEVEEQVCAAREKEIVDKLEEVNKALADTKVKDSTLIGSGVSKR